MKEMLNSAIESIKNTKMTKHYDSQTTISCNSSDANSLTLSLKGDITMDAIKIAAVCVIAMVTVSSFTMISFIKNNI